MSTPSRVNASVTNSRTPSGVAPFNGSTVVFGTALSLNSKRANMYVQNIHQTLPLYLSFGTTPVDTGNFSVILNPGTTATYAGQSYSSDVYKGSVTASGGAWIAWEM